MFSKKEIIEILQDENNKEIFSLADKVRQENVGDEVHLRGLIEFSNICKQNCMYCGLQSKNKNIHRYRMSEDEIFSCAQNAVDLGYKTVVLQSGEDDFYTTEKLSKLIERIKTLDVAVTLGIGERSFEDYQSLKNAGANRFLLRIETTDKQLYEKLHPNMSYENRVRCLKNLKELGYEVGSGCLVGLPNQTVESLADDILFFKEIGADMVGIGPFISHPCTPLKDLQNGSFNLALKVMAITRIMLPNINIPATTAMETLHTNGRIIALQSGANVVMPNVTDLMYRQNYQIYPEKFFDKDKSDIEEKIKMIGRVISKTYGNSKSF